MSAAHPANPLALAVLALLFERPMHPYEMAATMKERHKHDSIKLRYGSLYTVIDHLTARGYIVAKARKREGARPERTIYRLTPDGRAELRAWMRDLIGTPAKDYPQFEAGLCLLPVLPPDEVLALLRERAGRLDTTINEQTAQVRGAGEQFPPLFLIESEFRIAMLKAEHRFVADLTTRIEKGWGPIALWRGIHEDHKATLEKLYSELGDGPQT